MSNLLVTLPSGAELGATLASFPEGNKLFKAITRELESVDLNEDTVQKLAFKLMSSEEIEKALWPCMGRATYNKLKITPETFEDATARADYLAVAKEVMVFNLTPFFKSLNSLFKGLSLNDIVAQKSQ